VARFPDEQIVVIDGATTTVKVAHVRLCHSRMLFVRAYPRETQEMVFDAQDKAFAFFGGACARGIYDSGNCPPLVRGVAGEAPLVRAHRRRTRRRRWTRSLSVATVPTTAGSSRCAGITSSIRRPLGLNQWRLNERPCTPASGRSSGATPSSTPGSRTAVLPGPRPIRIRSFGIERSGMCSRTSARVLCPTSVRSIIARQAIAKQSAERRLPCRAGVGLEDLPRPV